MLNGKFAISDKTTDESLPTDWLKIQPWNHLSFLRSKVNPLGVKVGFLFRQRTYAD